MRLQGQLNISIVLLQYQSTTNILTHNLTAKVSDFGASRSILTDEIGVTAHEAHGYLDPEYYYTNRLTKNTDFYSFGVILSELLTGVKAVFSFHSSESTSLAYC